MGYKMAYRTYDRNPSGIVYFGTSASDQVFESNSNFTIDGTYLTASNLKISNGGTIGSAGDLDSISIGSNGDVTFSQSISIAGNLTVNGTTTTVNSTVVAIEDPIIILGSGSPLADDNKDRGISFNYYSAGSAKKGFFGYDDSSGKFTFIPDATITNEVVSGSTGTIVAALEGNATTATTLATSRNFSMTGEMTAATVSFNGGADVVLTGVLHQTAISAQSEITTVNDVGTDYLLIWDDTDDDLKKITRANFVSGLGTMSSFVISDGVNTQTVVNNDTLLFRNGAAINFTVSATDSVSGTLNSAVAGNGLTMTNQILAVGQGNGITVSADAIAVTAGSGISVDANGVHVIAGTGLSNTAAGLQIDLSEYTVPVAFASGDSFLVLDSDGSTEQRGTVSQLGTYLGGTNITVAGDGKLSVTDATIEAAVFTTANFVDGTTIDFTATAGQSVTAEVKDGAITEVKISRSVATVTTTSTLSSDINLCAGGAGGITVTLPAVATGKMVVVKKTDSAAGFVTVQRGGSSTIDGGTTFVLYYQYESVTLVCDGTNWHSI